MCRRGRQGWRAFWLGGLSCLAVLSVGSPAHGAAVVFVDPAVLCAGRAPCFPTIQEGVRNTSPGGVVNVFPADYPESVDIGLMGDAIGGTLGDLVIRTVSSAGSPTPGTASILPASGPAIFNSVAPFTGDFSIDGFTIQSPDDNGITLVIRGTVNLSHLVCDGNQEHGFSADFGDGDLNATDSSFSNNENRNGLEFEGVDDVHFERVTANANGDDGARFLATGNVRISESTFNDNENVGLRISSATDVSLDRVTADRNRQSGAIVFASGNVHIADSSFSESETGDGLFVNSAGLEAVRIVASGNTRSGLLVTAFRVSILASRFEDNGINGAFLGTRLPGEFVVRCNDFAGNAVGLFVSGGGMVLADSNYWGSPSGPTHPSNPGGTGDSVVDSANGGVGTVDFTPFLSKPAAESGQCATAPAPVLDTSALAILLLALFVFPARRLARARVARIS